MLLLRNKECRIFFFFNSLKIPVYFFVNILVPIYLRQIWRKCQQCCIVKINFNGICTKVFRKKLVKLVRYLLYHTDYSNIFIQEIIKKILPIFRFYYQLKHKLFSKKIVDLYFVLSACGYTQFFYKNNKKQEITYNV